MTYDLLWIFLFNLALDSTLAFLTIALLISLPLKIIGVSNPRLKMFILCIPLGKLVTDLFFYNFSNWALAHHENPLLAEQNTRQFSLIVNPLPVIEMTMQDGRTFTLADAIALSIPLIWVQACVLAIAAGSVFFLSAYLIQVSRGQRRLTAILERAVPITPLLKPELMAWMEKKRIRIYASDELIAPAISGKVIFLPHKLLRAFAREELEAVIAHELAHEYWQDVKIKQIVLFIGSVFWWVPTSFLRKRIEEEQELAADRMIRRFHISPLALAEALLKAVKEAKEAPSPLMIHFTSPVKKRMEHLLHEEVQPHPLLAALRYGILTVITAAVSLGKFWLF